MRSWAVSSSLFPCELSEATQAKAKKAVESAVAAWGVRQLSELEAEDRLSVACEKGFTADQQLLQLREAFQVGVAGRGWGRGWCFASRIYKAGRVWAR